MMRYHFVRSMAVFVCGVDALAADLVPKLEKSAVLKIANETARKIETDLSYFEPPIAYYKVDGSDLWWVKYTGKLLAPGMFFIITVHDKTREVEILPGS